MDTLMLNVRYALRSLSKSPGLVLAVILSLGLGIGANATIFSLVNTIVLRPIPSERPEELVALFTSESDGRRWGTSSYPDYKDLRDRARSFDQLATFAPTPLSLASEDGRGRRYLGAIASGNFFTTLGVLTQRGNRASVSASRSERAECVASWLPAWRASRVDPMTALRHE